MTRVTAVDQDQAHDLNAAISPTLRELLRSATSEIHERLHRHRGLAAVQDGTIDREAYKALLSRLYGFHRPFELASRMSPERTRWLENDLNVLNVDAGRRSALPFCTVFPRSPSPEYILGSRYVVEGSALGGRGLARQLDGLLGPGTIAGRCFFSGYGAQTGVEWRRYLDQISLAPETHAVRAAVKDGAIATFAIFEHWLAGWDQPHE